jgi:hypothetical protein
MPHEMADTRIGDRRGDQNDEDAKAADHVLDMSDCVQQKKRHREDQEITGDHGLHPRIMEKMCGGLIYELAPDSDKHRPDEGVQPKQ